MKICSKKDIKVITAVMAGTMLLGGCGKTSAKKNEIPLKNDPQLKTEIDLNEVKNTSYDEDLMNEEYRRYCFDLMNRSIADNNGSGNIMISPASIMMALDMVAAGSKNESLKQLTDLFAENQDPLMQQAFASALMDRINNSEEIEFSCANAVWSNRTLLGNSVNTEYVEYIEETFGAEYTQTEFDINTVNEINGWVDENTDHMIKEVVDSLDAETVMVLVNAIAFDAKWAEPYDSDHIKDGEFRSANSGTQNATFLNESTEYYFETEKATGFIKNYKGGEYAFLMILPAEESVNANEFLKGFTADDYEKFIKSRTDEYDVYTKMPEFKYDYEFSVNDTLKNLGVTDIFIPGKADLSGIAGAPGDIYVSQVIHKTHIEVDSNGTKAAAVTAVTLHCAGAEPVTREFRQVICDRPFAYAIVDLETMAPVFIGTVNEI
ncbi:MAG: serpin family protein [Clostridiales bacterium]|nr:serpin family protein [Clostridiales bacterium]